MKPYQTHFWNPESHPAVEQRMSRCASCAPVHMTSGYSSVVRDVASKHGALVRPMGSAIVVAPPLVVETRQLDSIVPALPTGSRVSILDP